MPIALSCTKCSAELPADLYNATTFALCPRCRAPLQLEVFPAFFKTPEAPQTGQVLVLEGEPSCFYHSRKKAVVPCDACGRFLCALCDVELDGRHVCPGCLELAAKKKTLSTFDDSRKLYGRQALLMAIVPIGLTGLAAIYVALRHWKSPGSLVRPMRWAMPVALILGTLQVIAIGLIIIAGINN